MCSSDLLLPEGTATPFGRKAQRHATDPLLLPGSIDIGGAFLLLPEGTATPFGPEGLHGTGGALLLPAPTLMAAIPFLLPGIAANFFPID